MTTPFAYNNNAFVYSGMWMTGSHTDANAVTRTCVYNNKYYSEVAFSFNGTQLQMYAAIGSGANVYYRLDGATTFTLIPNNGNVWGNITVVTGLAAGQHWIQFKCTTNAGQLSNTAANAPFWGIDTQAADAFTVTGGAETVSLPGTSDPYGFDVYSCGGTGNPQIFYVAETSLATMWITGQPGQLNVTLEDTAAAFATGSWVGPQSQNAVNHSWQLSTSTHYASSEAAMRFYAQCRAIWIYGSVGAVWAVRCGDVLVGSATTLQQVGVDATEYVWTKLVGGMSNVYPCEYTITLLQGAAVNGIAAIACESPAGANVFAGNPTNTNAALTANVSQSLPFAVAPGNFVGAMPLTINDGANTEIVVVASNYAPLAGVNSVPLAAPVKFNHLTNIPAFLGPPPPRSFLAALGDSFTLASTIYNPDTAYPRVLASQLGLALIARGVGGTSMTNFTGTTGAITLNPDVTKSLSVTARAGDVTAIRPYPKVLVLMCGTNDVYHSTENSAASGIYLGNAIGQVLTGGHTANFTIALFGQNYASLLQTLIAGCPGALILCCSIPPKTVTTGSTTYANDAIDPQGTGHQNSYWKSQFNAAIQAAVAAVGSGMVRYVDLVNPPNGPFVDTIPGITLEGWHPSPLGYKLMGSALLQQSLRLPVPRRIH